MPITVEPMTTMRAIDSLRAKFGEKVRTGAPLAPLTSARIGGPADILITVNSAQELADVVSTLWSEELPFFMLGGGSNVLIGDAGIRGVTVLNRAKAVEFRESPTGVWAESGVVFSNLANRCAGKGLSGLEWAGTVPGTIGGAVYGNAGAFGGDVARSLTTAELLTENGRVKWTAAEFRFGYRSSVLKRGEVKAVVLTAVWELQKSTPTAVKSKMDEFGELRKSTQPPGASMGSMFKNPPGDKAGRLIEAAGLKGTRVGNVEVSPVHANFFVNHGQATAEEVRALIKRVQDTVRAKIGTELDLEIELVGE
jgi:UDP-N-acetylmuramate dehydrogenase